MPRAVRSLRYRVRIRTFLTPFHPSGCLLDIHPIKPSRHNVTSSGRAGASRLEGDTLDCFPRQDPSA
jgi:hypothetical protein